MRLQIHSIQYAPEFTSNAIVITGLAQQLAARGHRVTVLAGTPHYQLPRVPPGYGWRPFRREILKGVKVIRCWAYPKSEGKVAKFLNYASFTLTSLIAGPFTERPDAVIVVSPPFWLGFNALLLGVFRRCAVIYNAQDLFPEAYLASQEVRPGWLARAMSGLMTRIYRASDRITVITGSFAEAIAARGIDRGKVVTIPNFVDTTAVTPLPRATSFRRRHGIDNRYVIMYSGNIGYTHDTELLVDAAEKLASIPDLLFLVIGGGSKQADLARLARERHVPNMQFLPTQPCEVLPEMLATADVFVLTSKPGVGEASFPARIYNFMLAARPVVASFDENSDLARVLRSGGAGIITAPGNVEDFCQALTTLYQDAALRERLGRSGAEFMARHYSPQEVVERYEALLKGLTPR
ncbi:MAG TPA: glycosyltransferase family 4 protein [Terriglobia bacterium]|nr:glycosyltransferase family 4 protein [Terriglobia bacterium]